ncbi:uronyl 2-sulfotransferase a isoform X2 [Ictalurus punctatus]|uniref:Uronyl 2-sulfotransferase a isoform X2 n=1 Tax=Ictalurus punctatus TaxID=7998 RepID=A0A979F7B1_ICTPU|nr:uronyl 2-sulfotransferase a isoform X2 [Ictalurus punctatus]
MKNHNGSPRLNHHHPANHTRDRNGRRGDWLWAVWLRFSLRDYGFCMAALLLFSLGSLFYQLNGGPPRLLLDMRQYLGESTFMDDHGPPVQKVLPFPSQVIYNRVGKCGSRTVVLLLRILAEKHQFNLVSSDIHNKTRLTKHEQDINVCILENFPECTNPRLFYIVPYFCGQHPQCREPGEWALERAKQNVMENFLLVGILEELEDVLLLLERLLPHYFSDVLTIYHSPAFWKVGNLTGTVKKHMPTLEALQVLYRRMRYEYDFYNFVRDQFHLVKKKIGLKSTHTSSVRELDFLRELALQTNDPLDEDDEDEEDDTALEDANNWLVQP